MALDTFAKAEADAPTTINGWTIQQDADDPAVFAGLIRRRPMRGPARLHGSCWWSPPRRIGRGGHDRFVPTDPNFIVANVRQVMPDAGLRDLIARWRADPGQRAAAVDWRKAFSSARAALREPMFVGPRRSGAGGGRDTAARHPPRRNDCMPRLCNIGTISPPPRPCSARRCARRRSTRRHARNAPRCDWCAAISPARAPIARD